MILDCDNIGYRNFDIKQLKQMAPITSVNIIIPPFNINRITMLKDYISNTS